VNDDPERVSVITLAAPVARDFECLLTEYAELMGASPEECRAGAEAMVGEAGVRAFNFAVMQNRKLAERMGWR
jgi:hypothetical protein